MKPFKYHLATSDADAFQRHAAAPKTRFLGGGTNIIDLMKEDVERPDALVDVTRLNHKEIRMTAAGLSIGAMNKNGETANHPLVREHYPLLSQAILAGASAQIRNMATNGGNLLQRTRCPYFYDVAMPCNKRQPGSGCGAKDGFNRMHAIFGWSEDCVAVFPSDMSIALAALNATVVTSQNGTPRKIAFSDFHRLPGDRPQQDHTLREGELITAIELPRNELAAHSYYLKVRDRASYAFALVSVAAALELDGNRIVQARLALGGVAHKPWRATAAEAFLKGKQASEATFREAAALELKNAKPLEHNRFKVDLTSRSIVFALNQALIRR
jgi:xanthine dehydrogenase YagS FAD-binding subunit